jgi:hypothetical protein
MVRTNEHESSKKRIARIDQEHQDKLKRQRELIANELPDLAKRDQMRKEAQEAPTLSGELRRAIHASELKLKTIAALTGIKLNMLDEFLTGEKTLRSDVMDRLANVLGLHLQRAS